MNCFKVCSVMVLFLAFPLSFTIAEEVRKLAPEEVCSSIDSAKYRAQCKTAIKDGYFDEQATRLCYAQRANYDKKICMEAIRGKDYTSTQLTNCVNGKSERLLICLKLNGEIRKEKAPSDEVETPIEN